LKVVLVGDSTVALGGGWGSGFCSHFSANVQCIDAARNGQSSKSFRDMGAWTHALKEHADYYLIQFGHNDEKPDAKRHTDPDSTFTEELRLYVHEARAIGAKPILVSPLARRAFRDGKPFNEDLQRYADAAQKVAREEKVPFVDLLSASSSLLSGLSQDRADEFDAMGHPDDRAENGNASLDRTHLNTKGQAVFGLIVSKRLVELCPELQGSFTMDSDSTAVQH
jgi:lysophospholipase L1-like esterase